MDWYLLLTSEGRSWMINIKDDEKDNTGDPKEITKDDDSFTARNNTLTLIDLFVDRPDSTNPCGSFNFYISTGPHLNRS